jgi:rhodanese-related sulfurtransferase
MGSGGFLLVDVREPSEVETCAYSGEIDLYYLPYAQLKRRWQELPRSRTLVFACLSGKRSLRAAVYLAFKGHPDVANLEGGMRAWIDAGMPVRSEHIKINSD